MSLKKISVILLMWCSTGLAYGFDGPKIPFLNSEPNFTIELGSNTDLQQLLTEELNYQRKNNRLLEQLSSTSNVTRYEKQLLEKRLHAEGYYAANITARHDEKHLYYRVIPEDRYTIRSLEVRHPDHIHTDNLDLSEVAKGQPLRAQAVLNAQTSIARHLQRNFCLYQIDIDYKVILSDRTRSGDLVITISNSPQAHIGNISINGLVTIDEDYLLDRIELKPGDCFDRSEIDKARIDLVQTNLLANVDTHTPPPDDGTIDITFEAVERFHRTLSAGLGYQKAQGLGVTLGWEHRNWLSRGENLSVDTQLSKKLPFVKTRLTFPHFQRNDQALTLYNEIKREESDAFDSKEYILGGELSRALTDHLTGTIGTEVEFSEVDEDNDIERHTFLSFPVGLEYDLRNAPLDPTSGWIATVRATPYSDLEQDGPSFLRTTLAMSGYRSIKHEHLTNTWAVRGATGSISNNNLKRVPANLRFYVGGGGSVRGYPFQSIGPYTNDKPDGGLSFFETSIESRLRFNKQWGAVLFLDGGSAFEDTTPQSLSGLKWGAGLGLRYYTDAMPIRFDLGFPLNDIEQVDDNFQIYISIGQSF